MTNAVIKKEPAHRTLAFDRASVRSFDADGIMHISKTPISKANVCRYQGKEIPDHEGLGLDPNKWYRMYRDPEELAKAASTFNNKPVLNKHLPFSVNEPPKDSIVGMTGDDTSFDHPYLNNSMTIFDGKQQAGIESDQHREISSSYYWTPDMTPGVSPEGEEYDGVMRDLICNHVAIVPDGRAGDDVLVYDEKPTGYKFMSKLSKKLWAAVSGKLASDADPEKVKKELDDIVDDEQTQAEKDNESEAERLKREEKEVKEREERERKDRERDRKTADDADEDKDEIIKELRAKLAKAETADDAEEKVKMACDALRAEQRELREAERLCSPIVGTLACDSAEELFRATLQHSGVANVDALPAAALKPMVELLKSKSLANDSRPASITSDSKANVMKMIRGGKA